jgi:prepilin-type processing-associated H-X9-DG protein
LSTISKSGSRLLRVRSYSMNGWLGQGATGWNAALFHVMQKSSEISQPDGTFVLIEEHPDSINDPLLLVDMAGTGSGTTIVDYPAAFHSGAANVAKADGRVEFWQWVDPRTMPSVRYNGLLALNVASPNNLDVARLQKATTYPR